MKKVRMLLRVSSNQQLDPDGDLSVQRRLVLDYIAGHEDWILDEKEYYEGSNSGYKNAVSQRQILQEALMDAEKHEYDILTAYKDDRIGRRMWEIGAYVMRLKSLGVDIYTVKDGCISPESDDIMGQMMLALRYGNAQKSSSDTGMRVKDTAKKLVQQGKFMGGAAPYGYRLIYSGQLSKHGRALHKLEIVPEQAQVIEYIYQLSCYRELGSLKIAKLLNEDDCCRTLAPIDIWKAGTISSILKNPIYAGYTAYKRRERANGSCHRLGQADWIMADIPNEEIQIISPTLWNETQDKRRERADKYRPSSAAAKTSTDIITRNDAILPLIDVLYCPLCGKKMTNGTKYHYWHVKGSLEKRSKKIRAYCCKAPQNGISFHAPLLLRADDIDDIILNCLSVYIEKLQKDENIADILLHCRHNEQQAKKARKKKLQKEADNIDGHLQILREHIPDALAGNGPLSASEIAATIHRLEEKRSLLDMQIKENEGVLQKTKEYDIPTWRQIFLEADKEIQRSLIHKLVERIEADKGNILIRFRIDGRCFYPE
ncbi:MAG: recombinase family protein [Bacillus sp. (in: Bacteria)]|nr:recombinase family protein [Bacillus sp. (in: firmicutes)]MCM1427239.1 recombinase family protein [Eubacterium sp.]